MDKIAYVSDKIRLLTLVILMIIQCNPVWSATIIITKRISVESMINLYPSLPISRPLIDKTAIYLYLGSFPVTSNPYFGQPTVNRIELEKIQLLQQADQFDEFIRICRICTVKTVKREKIKLEGFSHFDEVCNQKY